MLRLTSSLGQAKTQTNCSSPSGGPGPWVEILIGRLRGDDGAISRNAPILNTPV